VDPSEVGFVECHGTGTTLGDPIEVRALQAVYGTARPVDRPLLVQSVKTNVGHLEAAAGIAGLCKLLLALEHGTLPAHLHLREPNPYIPWRDIAVAPAQGPQPWPAGDGAARIGGLSSFGFSGTNVHMVVTEAPAPPSLDQPPARPHRVHLVSARSAGALDELATAHAGRLAGLDDAPWRDAAATSTIGRAHLDERIAVVAGSGDEASARLTAAAAGQVSADVVRGRAARRDDGVVLLFTGQGSQAAGMGAQLYETEPVFRASLQRSAEILRDISGFDLLGVAFDTGTREGRVSIHDTRATQPALFAHEVALAAVWRSWGIEPAAAMGHSIGEIAAAHVAGVLSHEDALRVVDARARLMQELPLDGGMAAVFADAGVVARAIAAHGAHLSIAARNGPRHVVISGRLDALAAATAELTAAGARVIRLSVSHAFHSPLMDPMLDAFERVVAGVELHDPEIEVISNRTAAVAEPGLLTTPAYWRDHARGDVRFAESVGHALQLGYRTFLEVGPGATLSGMARAVEGSEDATFVASGRGKGNETLDLHRAVATLHVAGVPLDWAGYEAPWPHRRASLPTYPFERQRFWHPRVEAARVGSDASAPAAAPSGTTLLGSPLRSPRLAGRVFERGLSPRSPAWLADHVIYGAVIVPATAYLELMRRAAVAADADPVDLVDVRIDEPLVLRGDSTASVQTIVDDDGTVEVHVEVEDGWHRHAVGVAVTAAHDDAVVFDTDALARCQEAIEGADYYRTLAELGVDYGPTFRCIQEAFRGDGEVVGTLRAPEGGDDGAVHPALADSCLQLLGLAMSTTGASGDAYVPVGVECWHVAGAAKGTLTAHGTIRPATAGEPPGAMAIADLQLFGADGGLVVAATGVRFRRAPRGAFAPARAAEPDWSLVPAWEPAPLTAAEGPDRVPGHWLVIGARGGLADELCLALASDGSATELVEPGGAALDPALAGPLTGVVVVASPAGDDDEAFVVADIVERMAGARLDAALTVLTQGAMAVVTGDRSPGHAQAAFWGVGRVAASEHPDRTCRLVDLPTVGAAASAVAELQADDRTEPQVAWRHGVRYALRLARPLDREVLTLPGGPYEMQIDERGRLDGLRLAPHELSTPGPGEVLIDVRATGLNFRDVLNVLGRYEGEPGPVGNECAGVVTAVGSGVHRTRPGDHVMALADTAFASTCVVPQEVVRVQPSGLSAAEAATIPIAFLTAHYAFSRIGQLRDGERVLIHAAAGGVGMAAVQLAQRAGADIFATAGSEAKRAVLRAMGVAHVYDSRGLDFADEIRRDTGGAGVDVVLNSLSGESIAHSVDALAPGGRFLEIGLAGIWEIERFASARPDASYHVVYLGEVVTKESALIAEMFDELGAAFDAGELRAMPLTAFEIRHAVDAFRYMAQARHIGKVVVTADVGWNVAAGGSWIITGGVGGLGLAVAEELATAGASRLVLCGRRPPSPEAAELLAGLRQHCPDLTVTSIDVADAAAVEGMVRDATADGMPLRGVVHAAGIVDDGLLRNLTPDRFAAVLRPKVDGARNLCAAVDPHRPDHVIFFAAGAGLFGPAGQGSYAAANATLDALAHARRAAGRPAQSIDWGPWSGVGMAARLDGATRRWEAQGVAAFDPLEGRTAFRSVIASGAAEVAMLKLRWPALLHHYSKHGVPPIMQGLVRAAQRRSVGDDSSVPAVDLAEELQALAPERRREHLAMRTREQVLRVLGLDPAHPVGPDQGLADLGMDSLMTVELGNRLSALVNRSLPSTVAYEHPTLEELTAHLQELLSDRVGFTAAPATPAKADALADLVAELADDELTDALLKELDDAGY
jgi:acyl transferase domain-containing protein